MLAIFPEISSCAAASDCERLAALVRKYFGGDNPGALVLDLQKIIDSIGIPISYRSMSLAGAIAYRDKDGKFEVSMMASDALGSFAKRFTLAHLLGHFFLHIQPKIAQGDADQGGFKEQISPLDRYQDGLGLEDLTAVQFAQEDLADRFAAAILVPGGLLKRLMTQETSLDALASRLQVTSQFLTRRLEDLGAGPKAIQNTVPNPVQKPVAPAARSTEDRSSGMNRIREIARQLERK
jgi:Zn-dependent peptidase ImmA (M78 family)